MIRRSIKIVFPLLFFTCMYCSCNYNHNTCVVENTKIILEKSTLKEFLLDENTPVDWLNIGIMHTTDSCFFLLYNLYTGELHYYDYYTCNYVKKHRLRNGYHGFTYDGNRFFFHDRYSNILHVYDSNLTLSESVPLPFDKSVNKSVRPSTSDFYNPAFKKDSLYYLTNYWIGESKDTRHYLVAYHPQSKALDYLCEYPELYNKAHWGGGMMKLGYSCINQNKADVVFSFPISHELYVYHINDQSTKQYCAGSSRIKSIPPYAKDKSKNCTDDDQINYFLESNSYGPVVYDQYRKLYYRVAETPAKNGRRASIIILDDLFNYKGEALLDDRNGTTIIPVPDGVLAPYLPGQETEKALRYQLYQIPEL